MTDAIERANRIVRRVGLEPADHADLVRWMAAEIEDALVADRRRRVAHSVHFRGNFDWQAKCGAHFIMTGRKLRPEWTTLDPDAVTCRRPGCMRHAQEARALSNPKANS